MPLTDDDELITEIDLARVLLRSRRQLQRDRAARQGIPFVIFGAQIRYRIRDLRRYIAEHLVGSIAEMDAPPARRRRLARTGSARQ
jgi:hypothetical protein